MTPLPDRPTFDELASWRATDDDAYAEWVSAVQPFDGLVWDQQRADAAMLAKRPLISVVTPVYNTDSATLRACIRSVTWQSYPHWQLLLVDDQSTREETLQVLADVGDSDDRITVERSVVKGGICGATNLGLSLATGSWVVFLDHDDVLSPEALWRVVQATRANPRSDIIYSDRDAIAPDGRRHWPFLKHGWSPEGLLCWNYLFHLTAYRRELVQELGGYRREYEGSQDLDLALRASEVGAVAVHIPRILYHWRQSEESIFADADNKPHTFTAGVAAVHDALERRGLKGVVTEPSADLRGIYRVDIQLPIEPWMTVVRVEGTENLAAALSRACFERSESEVVVFVHSDAVCSDADLSHLAGWLRMDGVGLASPRVVSEAGRVLCTEVVVGPGGRLVPLHRGSDPHVTQAMVLGSRVHNVLAGHPGCLAFRREDWLRAQVDQRLTPWDAISSFSHWLFVSGARGVFTPFCTLSMPEQRWDALGDPRRGSLVVARAWSEALGGNPDPSVPPRLDPLTGWIRASAPAF